MRSCRSPTIPVRFLWIVVGAATVVVWPSVPVVVTSVVLGMLAVWSCVANVSIARDYQLGRERVTTFRDSPR